MTNLPTRDPEVEPAAQLVGEGARALVDRVRRLAEGAIRLLALPRGLRDSVRHQVEESRVTISAGTNRKSERSR